MSHTPGPWEVRQDFYIGRAGKMSLAEVVSSDNGNLAVVKCGDVPHDDTETHKANARLIAAAPRLLEVCELLHARLFREQGGQEKSPWAAPLAVLSEAIRLAKGAKS